jgi:hypothetical protein
MGNLPANVEKQKKQSSGRSQDRPQQPRIGIHRGEKSETNEKQVQRKCQPQRRNRIRWNLLALRWSHSLFHLFERRSHDFPN